MVGAVAGIAGVLTFAVVSRTPVLYEASTTLVLQSRAPADAAGLPPGAATLRALLTNRNFLTGVLEETGLTGSGSPEEFVRDSMSIEEQQNTPFVRLRVRAADPALAAKIARLLAERAGAHADRFDREASADLAVQLQRQMAHAEARLKELEQNLLERRRTAQIDQLRAEVERILTRHGLSFPPGPVLAGSRSALPAAAPDTTARRAPGDPPRTLGEAELGRLGELYARELELSRLETEYAAASRIYSELAARYEQARLDGFQSRPLVRVMEPETAAGSPLPRGRLRKTLLAVFAGLLLGLALAVAIDARQVWRSVQGVR